MWLASHQKIQVANYNKSLLFTVSHSPSSLHRPAAEWLLACLAACATILTSESTTKKSLFCQRNRYRQRWFAQIGVHHDGPVLALSALACDQVSTFVSLNIDYIAAQRSQTTSDERWLSNTWSWNIAQAFCIAKARYYRAVSVTSATRLRRTLAGQPTVLDMSDKSRERCSVELRQWNIARTAINCVEIAPISEHWSR